MLLKSKEEIKKVFDLHWNKKSDTGFHYQDVMDKWGDSDIYDRIDELDEDLGNSYNSGFTNGVVWFIKNHIDLFSDNKEVK